MPERRVTNGERAALCGLRLLGVGFQDACQIVGVGHRTMQRYLSGDWWQSPLPVPLHKMTPEQRRRYGKARKCLSRETSFAEAMR
jgi:hypothetical protein